MFNKKHRGSVLGAFVAGLSKPDDAMTLHELNGFLFAIVCSPEPIQPAEWLPVVFDSRRPVFRTDAHAKEVFRSLMEL